MTDSIYPWPENWWTNTGTRSGSDLAVVPGSIFVPWATEAKPIGEGRWTVELEYTSSVATSVHIRHNPFSQADENHQIGQYDLGEFRLPAAVKRVEKVELTLSHKDQPLWTPQFQIPAGAPAGATFHRISVYATPAGPPPAAEDLTKRFVRSWAASEGGGGSVPPLSAASKVGDLAVIAYYSQWGNTAAAPPSGWRNLSNSSLSGRSGYLAARRVTDPAQTQGVVVTGKTVTSAREGAMLVVLKNTKSGVPYTWSTDALSPTGPTLVFSQHHGRNVDPLTDWRPPGSRMIAGHHDTAASWSAMLAGVVSSAPNPATSHGWARVEITPAEADEPDEGTSGTVQIQGLGEATVSVYEPAGEVPATLRAMPRGYASIDDMLRTPGFIVAHRGGSASWPEMSMRAYTSSVAHGAGALEVSTHRTKDGVWVLAHDQNLRRVDPTAPETPIAQMTWAEVQRYRTKGEPILRIEEYLEAYGSSHITVLDPKYSATQWSELALLLPSTAKDHVIWKSAGDATWLARQWTAAGWRCWGYAYAQHADNGDLAKWAPSWTYIGFPYDATTAQWSKARALGKPVWAHICPSRDAYLQGIGHGAVGCMVSGIADALPVRVV